MSAYQIRGNRTSAQEINPGSESRMANPAARSANQRVRFASVFLLSTVLPSFVAHADTIYCDGEYGDVELEGNLDVAEPCVLRGTEVDGNIRIFAGGSLTMIDAEIDGNVDGKLGDFVDIRNSAVSGGVRLEQMVGDVIVIADSTLRGRVEVKENRARLELRRNFVDDNVDAKENSGGLFITDNVIDGNLKCEKNDPAPVVENNSVDGKLEKQCNESSPAETPGGNGGGNGNANDDPPIAVDPGDQPPVLNTGTGGGGSLDPVSIAWAVAILLVAVSAERRRSRRRDPRTRG